VVDRLDEQGNGNSSDTEADDDRCDLEGTHGGHFTDA
jgi:hypothetical protein